MRTLILGLLLVGCGACGAGAGGLAIELRWPSAPPPGKAPAEVATIRLRLEGPELQEVRVPVAAGGFAWEALTPGSYELRVEALGRGEIPWYAGVATAEVRAGETTQLMVPLERTDVAAGR